MPAFFPPRRGASRSTPLPLLAPPAVGLLLHGMTESDAKPPGATTASPGGLQVDAPRDDPAQARPRRGSPLARALARCLVRASFSLHCPSDRSIRSDERKASSHRRAKKTAGEKLTRLRTRWSHRACRSQGKRPQPCKPPWRSPALT